MVVRHNEEVEFIDGFDGIVAIRTFGFESFRGDSPLFILRSSICKGSPVSLEEYILKYRTTPWQRFRALFLVNRILLGSFKKVGQIGYMDWYLFWCGRCEQLRVNYKQGFDNRLDCQFCQKRALKF
ncbi:MAG: hypothetical protein A2749_02360 [Parcubacteria group bacterium RIFCSPHIGHO2_01_FULL_45_26]|nr:MAG: hypothetical protein A2749_02360 [Parcubacteria group bacterium RIFCSPHIGHO2_01_FULL_45_26]